MGLGILELLESTLCKVLQGHLYFMGLEKRLRLGKMLLSRLVMRTPSC